MDSITIILVAIIFFLVIALIYTWSTKNQANKTSTNLKENNKTVINSTLELKIEKSATNKVKNKSKNKVILKKEESQLN